MAKHRVGIIGVGGIAGAHHRALLKMPETTIAGIADTNAAQLAKRSKEWGVPACESSEALLESDVESVFICTPPLTHRELVEQVAQAGKHIYLEKPIALSLDDADAIIAAAQQAGIKTVILPAQNEKDLVDVPEDTKRALKFVFAKTVDDVLLAALKPEKKRKH